MHNRVLMMATVEAFVWCVLFSQADDMSAQVQSEANLRRHSCHSRWLPAIPLAASRRFSAFLALYKFIHLCST